MRCGVIFLVLMVTGALMYIFFYDYIHEKKMEGFSVSAARNPRFAEWQVAILNTGELLIASEQKFIPYNTRGISGDFAGGSAIDVCNGMIDSLYLLSEGMVYEVYCKSKVIKALRDSSKDIFYDERTLLFYHQDQKTELDNDVFVCNYSVLVNADPAIPSKILFRYGKIWKIFEYDHNQNEIIAFDMDEIMAIHLNNGGFLPRYIDSGHSYYNERFSPQIKLKPVPYKKVSVIPEWLREFELIKNK